jgi:hypothetical protein
MSDFLYRMSSFDTNSLSLVIMICGWGFLIMRSMLPIAGLAIASFPVLVLSALAANALLRDTSYIIKLERGPGLALTTGIGMIVALTTIVILVRVWMLVRDMTTTQPTLLDTSSRHHSDASAQ